MVGITEEDSRKEKNEIFSVPSVGELTLRLLIKVGYDSLDKLRSVSSQDLSCLEHIGEIQAHRICIEIEEGQRRYENKKEIKCPTCGNFVFISKQSCSECGKGFTSIDQEIVLPGGTIVEEPLLVLAEIEEKLMDGKEDEHVWYAKGAILESMGALEKAYKAYDKVIEFDPLYDWIWNAKASLAMKLGKFEEATRAYKVAVDFRTDAIQFNGIMKAEPKPEPISSQPIEEKSIDVEVIEEKVSKVRQLLLQLDDGYIDTTGIEELLNMATRARNKDYREEALEYAEKVIDIGAKIEDALPTIEEIEQKIKDVADSHEGVDIHIERYNALKKRLGDWTYLEHIENVESLLDDLAGTLNALGTWEVYRNKFDTAKKVLAETRETKINLDSVKSLVRYAVETGKEGKFNRGLEIVDEMMECLDKVNEIHMKIQDAKEDIVKLNELGVDVNQLIQDIKCAKEMADKGEYDESIDMLDTITVRLEDETERAEKGGDGTKEEFSKEKAELNERSEETRKRLSELKTGPMNIERINEAMDEIIQDEKTGNYVDALHKIEALDKDISRVEHITKMLEVSMEKIDKLKSSGIDYQRYVKESRVAKKKADIGEYREAEEICIKILEDLDDELECMIEVVDLKEPTDKKLIYNKISELKSLIIFARDEDIHVEKAGERINMAMKSIGKGDLDTAFSYLEEGLTWLRGRLDEKLAEKIQHLEGMLEYSEEGKAYEDAKNFLVRAREEKEQGKTKKAFNLIAKAEIRGEEAKGETARTKDSIKYIEDILELSKTIGLELEDASEYVKDGQRAFSEGNIKEAYEHAEKAKDAAFEIIQSKISTIVDEAQRELKESKISGLNISKPIHLIKEVRKTEAEGELETSLKYLKAYREHMQSLRE